MCLIISSIQMSEFLEEQFKLKVFNHLTFFVKTTFWKIVLILNLNQ